jgi:predicted ATPase
LVGLSDENLIPQQIAQSLGVRETANEPLMETLGTHLEAKDLLIVLDNCEHLIRACTQYVEQLLARSSTLKILATSIETLGLFNETLWQVPSLPLPEMQGALSLKELQEFAGIELFEARALYAKSDFFLNEKNARFVAQICRRLDGIPLAIELAAARLKVLSVDEIAARLDDRFSLLTAGSRTAILRHQTLRATIDWSYELLTGLESILFRRLSVFVGGFTLEAAEAVCSQGMKPRDILDLLGHLVDKSLVIVEADSEIHGTRYRLLETVREYAREKLESFGETDMTRDQHLEFCRRLAEKAEIHHFTAEQLVWFDRVEAEIDNMRAAMDWSMTSAPGKDSSVGAWRQETGLRLMGALMWFWHRDYAREASERLKQMLAMNNQPTLGRARALYSLGFLYWTVNNFLEARRTLREALTISRTLEDRLTLARSLGYLGAVAATENDYASAQPLLEESLSIARTLGPVGRKAASWALASLGDVYFSQGDYSRSKTLYEEAVALTKEAHEKNMLGLMIRRLGYIALRQLDNRRASEYFVESLKLNQAVGHSVGLCASLTAFANFAMAQGKPSQAAQLYGAVESHLNKVGSPLFYSDKIEYQLGVSNLRNQLRGIALEKAWNKGAQMTMEEAVEFALKISDRETDDTESSSKMELRRSA